MSTGMKPVVVVRVKVSTDREELDISQIRSAQTRIKRLVASGKSALVVVDSNDTCRMHLDVAKKYSRDLKSVRSEIGRINAMLVISALRSAGIPTHVFPIEGARGAESFLVRVRDPTAAVSF
jgi:uridylate kinase